MKWLVSSLFLLVLAAPLRAADDALSLDPAAQAAIQKRWPESLGQIRGRLTQANEAAVFSSLRAAAAFAQAEASGSAQPRAAAVRDFQAAFVSLGRDQGRFVERGGGLGSIARDILGPDELLKILGKMGESNSEAILSMQAETLYAAGRYREAASLARRAWEMSGKTDSDALAILKSSEGRAPPETAKESPAAPPVKVNASESLMARSEPSFVLSKVEKRRTPAVPGVDRLNILDDETAAPEPSAVDRVLAFVTPSKKIVAEDIKTLRLHVAKFDIPSETVSLGSENLDAPRSFVAWVKTMGEGDLPDISYGALPAGQLASYQPGILGKGKIVMNYFIRDAEAAARSAVLFHELYHYWDFEIAKNPYPNVSYGQHSPAGLARREYDPYFLTALYWAQANPGDASSPLAKSLTALPSNPDDLQRRVDALISRRKDEK